jgi:hypothetical protein
MRQELKRSKLLAKIMSSDRAFFVNFVKKDGTKRKMLAKQGVSKNLKGGVNNVMKNSNDYLTTFDVRADGYRTINLATTTRAIIDGVKYKIVD